jgi:predicted acyltransferase
MAHELIQREAAVVREPAVQVEPAAATNGQQTPVPQPAPRDAEKRDFLRRRLVSLDVYRGLIMVTLAFNGFGLAATALNHLRDPDPATAPLALTAFGPAQEAGTYLQNTAREPGWAAVYHHFEHVEWTGCGYWDLIQPSFMFMVGLAAAFSYAKRRQLGQSYAGMFGHAVWRSLVLIFLGIFLTSNWSRTGTVWSLMNVLSQIGLGYWLLFLLWDRPVRTQALAAAGILLGTWLLYVLYPYSGINLETGDLTVGVSRQWAQDHLSNLSPAWHKNANVGHALDVWLLNLFPRSEPFVFNNGGYQTLNFVPSLATMLFGLMCGELLRSSRSAGRKLLILIAAGLGGLAVGYVLDVTGICPLVKRIWTPSWALYSTGWCCLILAGLYLVVDVIGLRRWAFPLVVVGVNSLAIYCMSQLLKPWVAGTLAVQSILVGLFFWLVCWWMYRQKIFLRI